jgi:hypothetical protein
LALAPKHVAGIALIAVGLLAFEGRAWRRVRGRRVVRAG